MLSNGLSSSGTGSGSSSTTCSLASPSGSRLVHSSDSFGHPASSRCRKAAIESRTCSQLSTIRSRGRSARYSMHAEAISARWPSWTSIAAATAAAVAPGSRTGASSTTQPPGLAGMRWRSTSRPSLVFPTPPGPTNVTTREFSISSSTSSISRSRPRIGSSGSGTGSVTAPPTRAISASDGASGVSTGAIHR